MSSPLPPSTQPHSLNLLSVLSETKRIITAHSRHFFALSVIFVLPLSFSVAIFPFLFQPSLSSPSNQFLFNSSTPHNFDFPNKTQLICKLLYVLCMFLFSLFASASITNSTFHGFSGRPVTILSSLKSILSSFFPLLATIISVQFFILLVSVGLAVIPIFSVLSVLVLSGVEPNIACKSSTFIIFASFISCLLVCVLVYLHIMLYLVHVVVVVESKWGFEAMKRSAYLVKGMRRILFRMLILFGILAGILLMVCSVLIPNVESSGDWVGWTFVVQRVVYVGFMTILMVFSVASNTVLFMYCKAFHGELALDIVDEFSKEYVSLPFNDGGNVTNVVCVV